MSVVDDVQTAAQALAAERSPQLRAMAVTYGLPRNLAESVRLVWDGKTFRAESDDKRMFLAEYGDGKQPARTPLRKALNALEPVLTKALADRVDQVVLPDVAL